MIIEADIYGIIARAKIASLPTAPPENILNRPSIPCCCRSNISANALILIPGKGMYVPTR